MTTQKISWDNYKAELEMMCIKTRSIKKNLLVLARKSEKWNRTLGYLAKILIIITGAGGGIQIFGDPSKDDFWLTVSRTVLEILIGIIVTTKDAFNFEKQTEKYYSAEKSINAFYEMLKFQSYQIKGTEGDRYEVLKGLKAMYAEIVANNQIIQTVESVSNTPDDSKIEIGDDDTTDNQPISSIPINSKESQEEDMASAEENLEPRKSIVPYDIKKSSDAIEERTRMYYLHKMLDEIH